MNTLKLPHNLTFNDLYDRDGLIQLDQAFLNTLETELKERLESARQHPPAELAESELILELAPHLEDFMATLFQIQPDVLKLSQQHNTLAPLYAAKRDFVRRRVLKAYSPENVQTFNGAALKKKLEAFMGIAYSDLRFATHVLRWMQNPSDSQEPLEVATQYGAWALVHREDSVLFSLPQKTDPQNLVNRDEIQPRHRDGFALTDPGPALDFVLDQAHYCIYCHHQGKDSCSKGLTEKGCDTFKTNALDVPLTGCPLEVKISEMNVLKSQGLCIGALGVLTIDNPLVAGTGHRICNDCSKSCIYQKQEPVDIPSIETRILNDVLELPYGFEVYSLLTRWNPLNFAAPLPEKDSGYKVLIAGMGPAGYTLAHYLLNAGHTVMGIDGLKIEPLDQPFTPIARVQDLYEPLESRVQAGFGGVAEYGITVRWNKNYLKLIRLLLTRQQRFSLQGGVRLQSNITLAQAFERGFDHVALCMGAGSPKIIQVQNNLANGVRKASDFLMALQLTGASRSKSNANLQLRLPVVVIGGGLTAIDTATEAASYYITQVEKFATTYQGSEGLSPQEVEVAHEFLTHAKAIAQERAQAGKENRFPNFQALLNQWGGVTVAYRKTLQDSPSYRLNHEEVAKAFEEGIHFEEHFTPLAIEVDAFNHAQALRSVEKKTLKARSILIAAGTQPNTILAQEDSGVSLEGTYFKATTRPEPIAKPKETHVFLDSPTYPNKISFLGDLHPSFKGNVVKAMASAKKAAPLITRQMREAPPQPAPNLPESLTSDLRAEVVRIQEIAPKIIEIVVKAPLAARNFKPGQFYRLQNYEATSGDPSKAMEGLALTGASVDSEAGTLSLIVLEMGASSQLCRHLKPREPVVLMGPTGTPTEIPEKETVLLAGGGLGNAVLFSIGQAMRAQGCHVVYFAAYRKAEDRFKQAEIEAAADQVIWVCEETEIPGSRPQDHTFKGNIVEAIQAYQDTPLKTFDRLLTIGSDRMMAAMQEAVQALPFKENLIQLASINAPMQCMMKEICAQCLQKQTDPKTGETRYVFSCHTQDQPLECVDFAFLKTRLAQNHLGEAVAKTA